MADDTVSASISPSHARSHSSLRTLNALSFVPAFPLCLTHGILSNHPVPAVGLVPLAISTATSIFLLRRNTEDDGPLARKLSHPVLVFVNDVVLAAALMVVLVFTWIARGTSPGLSMLAAYATIPLLFNFLIHLILALDAIYFGLAINHLVQWVAWRAVPPDCPHCHERLRPDFPELPWVDNLRRRQSSYAALFVNDEERYRDDPEGYHEETVHSPLPEPVEVRKKDRKSKGTSSSSSEEPTASLAPA